MAFLFHYNHCFALVDYSSRYGTFCQFFSSNSVSRPIQIQATHNENYSATLGPDYKLYIISMPDAYHIYYCSFENGRLLQKKLVAHATDNYTLSSPSIHYNGDTLYMTYLSNQVGTTTYSLVYQNIDASIFATLFTLPYEPKRLKRFTYKDTIYIFYISQDDCYHLNCCELRNNQLAHHSFINSMVPISDYSICIHNEQLHIVYVAEMHGKYQVYYACPHTALLEALCTTSEAECPVIYSYLDYLWINMYIEHQMHVLLSIDNGVHFSLPTPTSSQSNLSRYTFTSLTAPRLTAFELYASVSTTVQLSTIHMIDFEHIHPQTKIPIELDLLLEGMKLALSKQQINYSNEPQNDMMNVQDEDPIPYISKKDASNKGARDIKSAKNAFMEQLNGWDLPPKM